MAAPITAITTGWTQASDGSVSTYIRATSGGVFAEKGADPGAPGEFGIPLNPGDSVTFDAGDPVWVWTNKTGGCPVYVTAR